MGGARIFVGSALYRYLKCWRSFSRHPWFLTL